MDMLHEIEEFSRSRWPVGSKAMRRLNGIHDPLARQILAIHRECGSGSGVCDEHETTEVIAQHFGVENPVANEG
ncbi:hypothetical protein ACFQU3_03615 [Terrabacter sp. GCM10028922]|uniref:hypothetical protein n=1 Tax=Terrabacter sp. GCM10028922 TaxID=3273428 RepID=UPI00361314DC